MKKLLWIGAACALCGCGGAAVTADTPLAAIDGTYVGVSGDDMPVPYRTMINVADVGSTPVTIIADTLFVLPDGSWTEHGAFLLTTTSGPTVESFTSGPGAWTRVGATVVLGEEEHILFQGTIDGAQLVLHASGHSYLFSR